MTAPPRLLESADDEVRELLRTALNDAPDSRLLPSLRTALGVSAIAAVTSVASEASSAATGVIGHGSVTPGTASEALSGAATGALGKGTGIGGALASAGIAKFLIAGALLGTAVCAGFVLGSGRRGDDAAQRRAVPASAPPSPVVSAPEQPPAGREPEPVSIGSLASERAEPEAPRARAARRSKRSVAEKRASAARARSAATTEEDDASALAEEVKRIDAARRKLSAGDAAGALSALEHDATSSAPGVLTREALLLRVEALAQQGKLESARALARRYLAQYPGDVHAARMKELARAAK